MSSTESKKTAYPQSFRLNMEAEEYERLQRASDVQGKPMATIVRKAVKVHVTRILNEAKQAKKSE